MPANLTTGTNAQGQTRWTVTTTGPGGYFATYSPDAEGRLKLDMLSFNSRHDGGQSSPQQQIVVSDPSAIQQATAIPGLYTGIDITAEPDRELEGFLMLLYARGISITETNAAATIDLQADMEAGGVLEPPWQQGGVNHYRRIQPIDFLQLTGAIKYERRLLLPGQPRPDITKLARNGIEGTREVIRTLGMWGYADYLLTSWGISEQEYAEILAEWKPSRADRVQYVNTVLEPFARAQGWKVLSNQDRATIIGA